jgi:hypothetical protein
VSIWLERFVLTVCAAALLTIVVANTPKLDLTQRFTLGVAIVAISYFAAHTVHKQRNTQVQEQSSASLAPTRSQSPTESSNEEPGPKETLPKHRRAQKFTTASNPQLEKGHESVEKITFVEERIASPRPDLPNGLSVTLQTNVVVNPVHLRLECSSPIGDAQVSFAGPVSSMMGVMTTVDGNKFEFSIQNPPFTPRTPLVVTLFSVTPLSVFQVIHVY